MHQQSWNYLAMLKTVPELKKCIATVLKLVSVVHLRSCLRIPVTWQVVDPRQRSTPVSSPDNFALFPLYSFLAERRATAAAEDLHRKSSRGTAPYYAGARRISSGALVPELARVWRRARSSCSPRARTRWVDLAPSSASPPSSARPCSRRALLLLLQRRLRRRPGHAAARLSSCCYNGHRCSSRKHVEMSDVCAM